MVSRETIHHSNAVQAWFKIHRGIMAISVWRSILLETTPCYLPTGYHSDGFRQNQVAWSDTRRSLREIRKENHPRCQTLWFPSLSCSTNIKGVGAVVRLITPRHPVLFLKVYVDHIQTKGRAKGPCFCVLRLARMRDRMVKWPGNHLDNFSARFRLSISCTKKANPYPFRS